MNERRTDGALILFWLILIILSSFWIVFNFVNYRHLVLILPILQFGFILSYVSIIIAIIAIYEMLNNGILVNKTDKTKERQPLENNINEVYQYNHLLDPSDSDMNN